MIKIKKINLLLGFLLMFVNYTSLADNTVVVVPMSDDNLTPLSNIVTVAKENGDFTNPLAALASITDASSSNPYVLIIAPGIYPLVSQFIMKEYVDVVGSGQSITKLTGSIGSITPALRGLVKGANNASVRDLSIENINAPASSVGIHNISASPSIENVNVLLSGGSSFQTGIRSDTSSSPHINNVRIDVSGGDSVQYGLDNTGSTPMIANSTIILSDAGNIQQGIRNNASSSTISNVRIEVDGVDFAKTGIFSSNDSSIIVHNSHISVTGTSSNVSIRPGTGSGALESYISNTIVDAPFSGNSAKCSFVFDVTGIAYDQSCTPPPPPPP